MLSTFVAALALGAAQAQLTNPISLETKAVPVADALKKLSDASGFRLMESPQVKDEFLIIRVEAVPLKDIMDRIAEALGAEWLQESEGWRLTRTAKLIREQDQARIKRLAARFAEAQAKAKKDLSEEGAFDEKKARAVAERITAFADAAARREPGEREDYRVFQSLDRAMPSGRLGRSMAAALDPNELAKLRTPGRIVFSTAPNRMQRPLPRDAMRYLQSYAQEMALLRPHLPQHIEPGGGMPSSVFQALHFAKIKDPVPVKALVIVKAQELGGGPSVEVKLANAAGKIIDSSYYNLQIPDEMGPEPGPPVPDPTGAKPVELSPLSKELVEFFKMAMARGGDPTSIPPMGPKLLPTFLEPEKHTISELVLSDLLIGTAKAKKLNLVAAPTDLFGLMGTMLLGANEATPNQVLERFRKPIFEMTTVEKPGWVVLKVADPAQSRRMRVERGPLGKLVRAAHQKGYIPVDDLAAFAVSTPEEFERTPLMIHLMMTAPSAMRSMEQSSWTLLRFHGSLSALQRRGMAGGAKLLYPQMTPLQQRIFNQILFEEPDGMGSVRRRDFARPQPIVMEDEPYLDSLRYEATERCPNGVPGGAYASLTVTDGAIFIAKGTFGEFPTHADWDYHGLAMHLIQMEMPQPREGGPNYTEFSYAQRNRREYGFDVDPEFGFLGTLDEVSGQSKPVTSIDQFPEEIRAKIKQTMEEIRRGQAARRIPPPRS